jgi:LmbE family N-acetylglucosaminyl deacetylase
MDLFGLAPDDEAAGDAPRTLIIVAHPDDEVIGAGARLPLIRDVTIVHVTDGAPRDMRDATAHGFATREAYAAARRDELRAAVALAGITADRLELLNVVDQEASLALALLAQRIASMLRELRPALILTHPYEGGHPDHDATAFAVHAARCLLARESVDPPPVVEMAFYHACASGMAVGEFLPVAAHPVATMLLSPTERELKYRMRDCFVTQRRILEPFPMDHERFRRAPRYRFTAAPHRGMLLYERFDWGMTGERWRALAREALDALGLEEPL